MTRRIVLVPLFVAGLILAPSEISGKAHAAPAPAGSAAIPAASGLLAG